MTVPTVLSPQELARLTPAGLAIYISQGKWKLARHLKFINRKLLDIAAGRESRLILAIPPRFGKCLAYNTLCQMSNGSLKRIQDIKIGDKILSLNKEYKFEEDLVLAHVKSGLKKTFNICLTNNSNIDVSEDHLILTFDGWKKAKDIVLDDYLCCPNKLPHVSNIEVKPLDTIHRNKIALHGTGDIEWVKVRDIYKNESEVETYDVQICKNENLLTNNIVTHNSQFVSTYFIFWYLGHFPDKKVILITHTATFAEEFGLAVREMVRAYGKELFDIEVSDDKATAGNWKLKGKEGGMIAVGVGGPIMGRGADLLIIDDPIKNLIACSEKINTKDGWKVLGDIKVGDYVFDHLGELTKVTGVSEKIKANKTIITFSDGTKIIAHPDHPWTCFNRKSHSNYTNKYKKYDKNWWKWSNKGNSKTITVTTKDFEHNLKNIKGQTNWIIPNTYCINYDYQELEVNPYIVGLWLGDGSTDSPRITCSKEDVVFYTDILSKLGIIYNIYSPSPMASKLSPNTCIIAMKDMGITYTKECIFRKNNKKVIPIKYIRNSYEQRLLLLQGLMDSDGTIASGQAIFCNKDKHIIDSMYEIIVSLGEKATIHEKYNEYGLYWTISFTPTFCPFRLLRKVDKWNKESGKVSIRRLNRTVVNVETFDEEVEYVCINVETDSHLYLIGKSLVPTHNSEEAESKLIKDKLWSWIGCFHPDTEIFTEDGWKNITDITLNDKVATLNTNNNYLEYECPSKLYKYEYDGQMYDVYQPKGLAFNVTPNHNILHKNIEEDNLQVDEIRNLEGDILIPVSCEWNGLEVDDYVTFKHDKNKSYTFSMGDWLELIGWYLSEGSICRKKNSIIISQKTNITVLKDLLDKMGIRYWYYSNSFRFQNKEICEYFSTLGKDCYTKFIPKELKKYKKELLFRLLKGLIYGDGSLKEGFTRFCYYTSSKQLANDVFEIGFKCGYKASCISREPDINREHYIGSNRIYDKTIIYKLSFNTKKYEKVRLSGKVYAHSSRLALKKLSYSGNVYCLTMPSYHNVLIKYKGKISWSGQSTAISRLQPGLSSCLVVHQRWAEDDIVGRLLAAEKEGGEHWNLINFPAIAVEDELPFPEGMGRKKGDSLWPELWPLDALLRKKNSGTMTSSQWESLYQQNPISDTGGIFKRDWFQYFSISGDWLILEGKSGTKYIPIDKLTIFVTSDTADKTKRTSDYSVMGVWGVTPKNDLLLLELYRDRYEYEYLLKLMQLIKDKWNPEYFGIENKGIAIQLINEARNKGFAIRALEPQGKGKQNRANMPLGAVVRMESLQVYFPKNATNIDELELELLSFPKGRYDDIVDVVVYACNELTKMDYFGEDDFPPYQVEPTLGIKKGTNYSDFI